MAFDASGNFYVADSINNRVLEYDNPNAAGGGTPGTPGAAGDTTADRVFGTCGSFTSYACNTIDANSLASPLGVAVDSSGHLYVDDGEDNRVLEYNDPLASTTADTVFGQGGSFTSIDCNSDTGGGSNPTANDLCDPFGLAVDASGNLYVADGGNNRVLKYNQPAGSPSPSAATPVATPGAPTTLKASPAKLNFGKVDATGTSRPQKVTLTNKGTVTAMISPVTATPPFAIAAPDTCSGQSIAPRKTCAFEVEFAPPTVANTPGGSVTITYNGPSPSVTLEGDGVAAELSAPKAESFAAVRAGTAGKPTMIVISNPSTVPVTLGTATLGAPDSTSFTIANDQCSGQPLQPKGRCRVSIEFAPPAAASGVQSSALSFSYTYGANGGNVSTGLKGKAK
jgi:sugar lactone lactonase YvrE